MLVETIGTEVFWLIREEFQVVSKKVSINSDFQTIIVLACNSLLERYGNYLSTNIVIIFCSNIQKYYLHLSFSNYSLPISLSLSFIGEKKSFLSSSLLIFISCNNRNIESPRFSIHPRDGTFHRRIREALLMDYFEEIARQRSVARVEREAIQEGDTTNP